MKRRQGLGMLLVALALGCPGLALAADAKFDLSGPWQLHWDVGGRQGSVQIELKQEGTRLSGQQQGPSGKPGATKVSGTVDGDTIEFHYTTFAGTATYRGTIDSADKMHGEADHVAAKGTWTATRGEGKPSVAPPSPSVAKAEERVQEFGRLFEAGDIAEFKKFAAENFAPKFLNDVPMERHLEFFLATHNQTRGLGFHSFENARPNQATGVFKSKLTGRWMTITARVEPQEPYRIVGLGAGAPKTSPDTAPARKLTDDEIAGELGSLMQKLADADVFSGTVLLARDGKTIFQAAYGTANKDYNVPNQLDTKFNLGSMNKMFTAVAVAQLVERGKLSFDDPLSKFLPDFPDAESAQKIQVKHLLSHTAGLGGFFSKPWQESSRALYRTVDDQIKRAKADEKLLFTPGTRHRYSNTGMLVAGKVIEVAADQDYYDYVRENIYKPAGMLNTDCYELDKVNTNLAVGYEKQYGEGGVSFRNNIFEHVMRGGPQGGGYSTVVDLHKFDRALRSNKLVGAEYVKLLLSAKPELYSPSYGYGFQIEEQGKIVGHGGGFIGINSNLDMFLGTGWTAAVMSNYGRGAMVPQQAMRDLVRGQLESEEAAAK